MILLLQITSPTTGAYPSWPIHWIVPTASAVGYLTRKLPSRRLFIYVPTYSTMSPLAPVNKVSFLGCIGERKRFRRASAVHQGKDG
jgi:hypothetical protein